MDLGSDYCLFGFFFPFVLADKRSISSFKKFTFRPYDNLDFKTVVSWKTHTKKFTFSVAPLEASQLASGPGIVFYML